MDNGKKQLVKNGFLLTLAPFLPKAINILLLPIMTKYLTDVDYGISATIKAYSSSIGAFATLGLTVVINNAFFKDPEHYKTLWRELYGFLKIWMVIYACIQAVILYIFIPDEAANNRWWIIILTNFSTVFFGPTGTLGSTYYICSKQSVPVVWRSVGASLVTIATNYILIVGLRWGYMGWYVGGFAGTFFTNASYWYVVNKKLGIKPIYTFKLSTIKHALKVGVPTIPHYYTSYLLEGSGKMVMDQYSVPQSEIGRVSVSQQFGDMFQMAMQGMNNAVSPFVMQSIKSGIETRIKQLSYLFVSIVFSLAFVASLWSKEIFCLLLSNESLASAYHFFILYCMALCYRPMYYVVSYYYFYYEQTKQLLLITFVSGVLAILIYIIFTPVIGVWAFLIGHYVASLYYGYSGYLYSGYKKKAKIKLPFVRIMLLQIGLTAAAYFLVDWLLVKTIVTIILAIIIIFIIFKNKGLLLSFKK